MRLYKYTGADESGKRVTGRLKAMSATAAASLLRTESSIRVRSIEEDISRSIKGKPTGREMETFFYALGDMLESGAPMLESLAAVKASFEGTPLGALCGEIKDDIEAALPPSDALARHPSIFTRLDIGIVKAGEDTGTLDAALKRVHDMRKFSREMTEQVNRALLYPKIVLGVCLAGLLVVNFFVLPTFATIYKGFNSELPWITQVFMNMSAFCIANWHYILGGLVYGGWSILKWSNTDSGRASIERVAAKTPILKKLVMKAALARYCHVLADGHASGLPINETMALAINATGNIHFEEKLSVIVQRLDEGKDIPTAFASCEVFREKDNLIPLAMISTSAQNGRLDSGLKKLAAMFKYETEEAVKMLPSYIEPLMILVIGALVLVMIIAIGLPIWDLAKVALRAH